MASGFLTYYVYVSCGKMALHVLVELEHVFQLQPEFFVPLLKVCQLPTGSHRCHFELILEECHLLTQIPVLLFKCLHTISATTSPAKLETLTSFVILVLAASSSAISALWDCSCASCRHTNTRGHEVILTPDCTSEGSVSINLSCVSMPCPDNSSLLSGQVDRARALLIKSRIALSCKQP